MLQWRELVAGSWLVALGAWNLALQRLHGLRRLALQRLHSLRRLFVWPYYVLREEKRRRARARTREKDERRGRLRKSYEQVPKVLAAGSLGISSRLPDRVMHVESA